MYPDAGFRAIVRAFWAFLRVHLAVELEYRGEMFIWLVRGVVAPLVNLAVWTAVAGEGEVGGFARAELVSYFLAVVAVERVTLEWIVWDLEHGLRTGELSPKLLRPAPPVVEWAAHHAAYKLVEVSAYLVAWPLLLRALGGAPYDLDPGRVVLFALSALLGATLRFAMAFCVGTLAFRTTRAVSIYRILDLSLIFFSGSLAPLALLPAPLRAAAQALPFRGVIAIPVEILMGRADRAGVGLQLTWLSLFLPLAYLAWRLALRHHDAVGA
ncbi:MAG: ABC-2 family transporter protein [Clostridia bacterium]|nr:ABC-2 family transporter protein [Clostridia bacterium]